MSEKMFCHRCNALIEEPSVNSPGPEWVRFHTGRCPKCETPLEHAAPSGGKYTAGKSRFVSEPDMTSKGPKQNGGFFGKLFGGVSKTEGETNIVTGGHKFGPIGEKRLNIAANHVCQQLQQHFGKAVKRLSVSASRDVGLCLITITTRKGTDAGMCKQIGDTANALLDTEAALQHYVDDLVLVIGNHNLVGSNQGFLGSAREDARTIGQNIYNHFGLAGMTYVCSILGELWPHTGLMRSLEVAWNRIGGWAS
ncbi:MAG: hypothetical protein Q8O43_04435 [Dehalococcoidia bacterium]|nr:hypothetical protein [Dehalococcoidia bacterium]